MFWSDDDDKQEFQVPDDIQDLVFRLKGKSLPVDHANDLRNEVLRVLPWMADTDTAGIHSINVAATGNGWYRPEGGEEDAVLYISRRTRMHLRLPKERLQDAQALVGATLNLGGHELIVGEAESKPLSTMTTIFARYVVAKAGETEDRYLSRMAGQIAEQHGIRVRKLMCGRETVFQTADGPLVTRSLMLADIDKEESVRLQCAGLGPHRLLGCGIFIPHKGIAAVKESSDE